MLGDPSLQSEVEEKTMTVQMNTKEVDNRWVEKQLGKDLQQVWNSDEATKNLLLEPMSSASTRVSTMASVDAEAFDAKAVVKSDKSESELDEDATADSGGSSGCGSDIDSAEEQEEKKKNMGERSICCLRPTKFWSTPPNSGGDPYSASAPPYSVRRRSPVIEAFMDLKSPRNEAKYQKPRFDTLTIRTWFMTADKDNDGQVTKQEFMNFMVAEPVVMLLLFKELGDANWAHVIRGSLEWHAKQAAQSESHRLARVRRYLLKLWKTIATREDLGLNDQNSLGFEEWMEVFERTGCVLEYSTVDNPRDRAADDLEQLVGTGPIQNVRDASQQARRVSEAEWVRDFQAAVYKKNASITRRHTVGGIPGKSPAAFWSSTLVLGTANGRRQSWGGSSKDARRGSWGGGI